MGGLFLNRKAQITTTAVLITIIVIIFLGYVVRINSRECNSNKDCNEDQYCGSDFSCHNIPIIEKEVVKRSWTVPILIISITLIILAIIFRWEQLFGKKTKKVKETKTKETEEVDDPETYYTSQVQYTAK